MNKARWAFVAFWSKNIRKAMAGGLETPGFSYEADELKSMEAFAESFTDGDYAVSILVNAVLFVLGAAVLMGADTLLMMHLASHAPLTNVQIIAPFVVVLVLSFSAMFPLTMTLTGVLVLRRRQLPADLNLSTLRALHRRILWQFLRLGVFAVSAVLVVALIVGRNDGVYGVIGPIVEVAAPLLAVVMLLMIASRKKGE
jgi:hypothetical protein